MRYDDASQTGSSAADNAPVARPDVDAIAPGSFSPASGNAITGAGTTSGLAGADAPANGSRIVEVHGAGGPTAGSGNAFQANGQYGVLNMDAQGNFTYVRNPGTPDGVQDVFGYTLADAKGATSSTTLTMDIGGIASAAATAATQGIVNLPAGVEMSDIKVNGRDLVIQMPDGTQMVIPGGAVFVPQLVIGDVQVPSSNLAALLIDSEPKPAAGSLQSSGGNFDVPVPPLDPGVPLGDLIPPTELAFTPPEVREVNQFIDEDVDAGTAFAQLDDDAQAGGIAGGVGDDPGGSVATGFLPGSNGDGDLEWALLSSGAPAGFSYADGPDGSVLVFQNGNANAVLRIDIDPDTGAYTVTQLGPIAHPAGGDENNVEIVINYTVTDEDGDDDTGSLTINIDDDTPVAQNDTDAIVGKATSTDGNVITGVGTTSGNAGVDSPGADGFGPPGNPNHPVNGVLAGTSGAFAAPGTSVIGQFGTLVMDNTGHYVYTRAEGSRQGGTDVFTYRIIDGDGDETTATLTITVPADPVPQPTAAAAIVDDDGLVPGDQDDGAGDDVVPDNDGDGLQSTFRGTLTANFGSDGPNATNAFDLHAMDGVSQVIGQETVTYHWNDATDTLTAEITASTIAGRIESNLYQVHVNPITGVFDVALLQNVLQVDEVANFENNATAALTFTAVDSNNDATNSTLTITFDDDIPQPIQPPPPNEGQPPVPLIGGLVDEDDLHTGPPQNDNVTGNHDSQPGDDAPVDARAGDPDPTTTGDGPGSLGALFNIGADDDVGGEGDTAGVSYSLNTDTSALTLQALTSNGHALIYDVNAAAGVLTAHADLNGNGIFDANETIFTLTIAENGSWEFNLQGALDHPAPLPGAPAFENDLDIDLSSMVRVTDSDGDSATAAAGAFVITVDDDIPTAKPPEFPNEGQTPAPIITGLVDEDDLPTGNHDHLAGDDEPGNLDGDNDGTTTGGNATNLTELFNAGADQPLTILLSQNTSALEAQNLKSQGQALSYSVNVATGVLTGYVESGGAGGLDGADRVVFTLTVDASDGSWVFDLVDQLDHSPPAPGAPGFENNLFIDFSSVITAQDSDHDPVTAQAGTFVINVDDDMPQEFDGCPDDVIAVNDIGSHFDGNLNLPPVGADEPGKVTFGVSNGDPVLDTDGHPVTSGGQPLVYFINGDVLEAHVGDASGDIIFKITLNGDGTFDYDQLGPITSETELHITDLSSVGGGNVDAKVIDVDNSPFDLVLSTQNGTTVNTNNTEIGIGAGQSFENGEILRVDLVQNSFASGSGGNTVLNFGEYYTANSYQQHVSGMSGPQRADFTVKAIAVHEAAGSNLGDPADGDLVFYGDTNDTFVAGTTFQIFAPGSDVPLSDAQLALAGITVTAIADGWQVLNLPNDYDFRISSTTAFNAVQIEALPTTDTFKLGIIDITSTVQTDVDLSVPVVFTDFDGDPVTCDIDINLGPPSNTPNVTIVVDEAALNSVGSDPGSTAETQGGDLSTVVTGGTGPYSFVLIGANADGNSPYGHMTLNPDGTFSFTLTSPFDTSPDADNGKQVEAGVLTFTYQATDSLGATSTGTITVNIRDDAPLAVDDLDSIALGGDAASGNVITGAVIGSVTDDSNATDGSADTLGADRPVLVTAITFNGTTIAVPNGGFTTIDGDNGTLKIYSNGDYLYTRESGSPGNSQDVFTYTITDADGDTDQADLTITIADAPVTDQIPSDEAQTFVYENALGTNPQGTSEAAAPGPNDDPNEVVTGSITFTAPDGLGSITIGGTAVNLANPFPQTMVDDATGKLEVLGVTYNPVTGNGSISYRYTLEDNTLGNQAVNGGNTTIPFAVDIVDTDGDHSPPGNLVITIVDDAPIAADDSNSVSEGASVNGTVLTNDLSGADGYGAKAVVGGVVGTNDAVDTQNMAGTQLVLVGTYGSLTLHSDGTYTYDANPNSNPPAGAHDDFTYTIRDGDGDLDSAVLTINVSDVTLVADNRDLDVFEKALDLQATGSDLAPGTVTGSDPTNTGETVTGTLSVPGATSYALNGSATGTHGIIQINSNGTFTYTLTSPVDGPTTDNGANEFNNVESFSYTATDANGNTVNGTITIDVIDDVPQAFANTNTVTEGATVNGNVLTDGTDDVFGADGQAPGGGVTGVATGSNTASPVSGNIGVPLAGLYGSLTLNANGTYSYHANANAITANQVDHFVYTITDGDGDTSTVTLDINVNNTTVTAVDTEALVNEAGLPVIGSNAASNSEVFNGSITPSGGTGPYTYTLNSSSNGTYGNLVLNSDGTYSYTLDTPFDGPTNNNGTDTINGAESFNYTVTDANGNTTTGTIVVSIIDDVPSNYVPNAAIAENTGTDVVTDKLDTDGTLANNDGADGIASLVWNVGAAGTVLLDSDGNPVTVGGAQVKLYVQPDGSLVATTDIANAAAKVFTATLNAGTSEYTIDFDRPLDNGSTSASDFTSLAAGNTPWKGLDTTLLPDGTHPAIGDPEVGAANDSTDLLFTGYNAGGLITINTDNDDIGTGGGQKVNANEYLRVDIVQDLRRDAGQSESNAGGYTYDDHVGQKVFSFSTVDVQGNAAQTATILVRAWNVNDASATAQSDVNNAGINTQVDIDPASVVVHSAGGTLLVEGVGYNVVEFGNAIYVSGLHDGDVVTFQATGGATFEAVTLENGSGDANPEGGTFGGNPVGLGGFAFGANDPGDPVEFSLPTLLTDGDGDQSSGTVDVTVYPVGQVPTTLAATGSLFSANDNNSFEQQKLFANGTNSVLMGALAAAGLASDPIAANAIGKDGATDPQVASLAVNDTSSVAGDSGPSVDSQNSSDALVGSAPAAHDDAPNAGAPSADSQPAHDNALDASHQDNSAPAELLQGTDAPAQTEAAANPFTADAIQMPAADQLVAKDGGAVAGDNVQHNAVVGQVLADALNGGDSPHIEAALNAVTGGGDAATAANDALASHGSGAVSNGDMPDLAAFIAAHGVGMVAPMEMHHDAPAAV